MASLKGKPDLNAEASEIEVNGEFLLTEEDLKKVAGGRKSKKDGASCSPLTYAKTL